MPTLGIIVGSIAAASINRQVATALPGLAQDSDVEFRFLEYKDLPMYDYAFDQDYPQVARDWKQSIADVDGIIIVTPEYSRSIPGALKNALDWAARPWGQGSFAGKPVAIMGASVGPTGTAAAQQHLRAILGHYDAITMGQPETFFVYRAEAFAADGSVHDERGHAVLSAFVNAAVAHTRRHTALSA